jgi:hypothetical protein
MSHWFSLQTVLLLLVTESNIFQPLLYGIVPGHHRRRLKAWSDFQFLGVKASSLYLPGTSSMVISARSIDCAKTRCSRISLRL